MASLQTLAFAEARPHLNDHGVISIVMRRSMDAGCTWSGAVVVIDGTMIRGPVGRAATIGNPTAVFDASTSTIWMLFCTNHVRHRLEFAPSLIVWR